MMVNPNLVINTKCNNTDTFIIDVDSVYHILLVKKIMSKHKKDPNY